jgi:CubicO group peptidase (beta-lactamase class C family)
MRLPRHPAFAALFTGFTLAAAAPATPATPDFSAIAPKMQAFVDQGQVAGVVTLVATKDKILHLAAVGQSDLATGRKMQPDDLFWIASMSKPMTAVAVALLVDDGKLSFDDPVGKYLPEFNNLWVTQTSARDQRVLVPAARPITLRDLLTHTSGLGEYQVTGPHWTLGEMAQVLSREPLRFAPGSRWAYSTAGLDLAGCVVEKVSGMPYDQFMQKRLFDALGMKDTTFWISPEQKSRYAETYKRDRAGKLAPTPIHYLYGTEPTDPGRPPLGGAGLFSTAADVAKFYQMMLNGGALNGKQILKPETVAELLRKQTGELTARPGMPWGLGFSIIEDPSKMEANNLFPAESFGHGGAFGTNSWADPKNGVIYVLMLELDGQPNPDNSAMRIEFQKAAAAALGQ